MGAYVVKRIDEMEAVFQGAFKRARAQGRHRGCIMGAEVLNSPVV
jgi:hypothetical protein